MPSNRFRPIIFLTAIFFITSPLLAADETKSTKTEPWKAEDIIYDESVGVAGMGEK